MRKFTLRKGVLALLALIVFNQLLAQTPAFPGAEGFGRFATGARGVANPQVYHVTSLADSGPGSFRDAVSAPGRFVVFEVGGIVNLQSDIVVAANTTIAGQTAPGDGIVFVGKRITFTSSSNTICRYLRIRLGNAGNSGKDASGLANGANMIFDHMSFTWGMDEVFSINWDSKGTAPDNITVQNSIIGQGLHRENHSAGGLIQTPDGGKVSLIRNLYISNKTRNPKVKGVNEFVNNVVYDWGNGNRLGETLNYGWSGDGYIMGGSSGVSEVNIINNYFVSGPLTPPTVSTPFSRGTGTFFLYGAGNYFDGNKNGTLDGTLVPYDNNGYPGIEPAGFKPSPFAYPKASTSLSAQQAYQWVIDSVGPSYPRRDQLDSMLVDEVASKGLKGWYVYRETDLPLANGGVGNVFNAPSQLDSDNDGMPNAWEIASGLNPSNASDAVVYSISQPQYLNIEVYINGLMNTAPPAFVKPPTNVLLSATSVELPVPASTVVINWTDNANNEDYFILERSTNGTNFTDIYHPAVNAQTYTDASGLLPNTTYYYRLKAVNASGSSSYSPVVSIKTPQIPTAPVAASAPTPSDGYQYVELVQGKTTLKWTGTNTTTTYSVYFGTGPASLVKLTDLPYTAQPSFQLTGLVDFTTYYWRIDATNAKGTTEGPVWSFRTSKNFPLGLVGHWAFDETGEGTQVIDSSIYENHGILGLDDDDQSIRVPGKVKGGIDFATAMTNMYVVSVPHQDHLFLDKGSFSLSFWMKAPAALLPQDNNTSSYLLCKGSITRNGTTGATGKRFDIEFKNKQIRFAIDDDNDAGGGGKDELQADGIPFFTNQWVHVVVIRDTASKRLRLYMNGNFVKEQAVTKALSGIGEASDLVVGNIGELEFLSNANAPAPYKGMLDELKVFNYSLNANQVLELFHTSPLPLQPYAASPSNGSFLEGFGNEITLAWKGGLKTTQYKLYTGSSPAALSYVADVSLADASYTLNNLAPQTTYYWRVDAVGPAGTTTGEVWTYRAVSPKGLVGHYRLDETSGLIASDNSNYHHNGTVINMPEATWLAGRFGNALQFKNPVAASAVSIPHAEHLNFDQNSFSISMWIRLTNGSSNYNSASPAKDCYLLHKGQFTDPGGKWYGIQLRDSVLTFAIDDASVKSNLDISLKKATANFIFNNNWSHLVVIKDTATKTLRIFINGVQVGSKAYTTLGTIGKALPLLIGNSAENKPFHDQMDDVRLYNYSLSASEITKLYSGSPLLAKVTDPVPANGAPTVHYKDINLEWKGEGQKYNLYAGNTANNLVLVASDLSTASYILPGINALQTKYWRVDAMRDGEEVTGDVWSFTIRDTVKPVVLTNNLTVMLDPQGQGSISITDADNGSNDDFGIMTRSLSQTSFNCSHAGPNSVSLTVTDQNGNTASASLVVTVVDAVKPSVVTKNISVTLVNGSASILPSDIDNGSADACGIKSMILSRNNFGCADIGSNNVELIVIDVHDNMQKATAQVAVLGQVPQPSITITPAAGLPTGGPPNTVYLGYGPQQLMLNAVAAGSSLQYTWSNTAGLSSATIANPVFAPTEPGDFPVSVRVTNVYGCYATAATTLHVVDARCGNGKVLVCHQGTQLCLGGASVQAHLAHGCQLASCASNTSSRGGTTSSIPSYTEIVEDAPLTLIPSITSSSTTISFSTITGGAYRVELYSAEGRFIRSITKGMAGAGLVQQRFSTSELSAGLYYVRLINSGGVQTKKLIVQRK